MTDNRTPEDYAALEWDKQGMRLADNPKALLDLPEGLLMLEGLPVMLHGAAYYPVIEDKVLAAAEHILTHRNAVQAEQVFHNQAEVMAFASQQFDWHTGKDMRLVSTANYMGLEKPSPEEKAAKAEVIDAHIEMLNSGLLTTREGAKKLFPDMDVDDVFDKHEQRIADAKEQQQRQMDAILEKLKQEKADTPAAARTDAKSEPKDGKWAEQIREKRTHKPNPCLGF